jgi:hypothetical protein
MTSSDFSGSVGSYGAAEKYKYKQRPEDAKLLVVFSSDPPSF